MQKLHALEDAKTAEVTAVSNKLNAELGRIKEDRAREMAVLRERNQRLDDELGRARKEAEEGKGRNPGSDFPFSVSFYMVLLEASCVCPFFAVVDCGKGIGTTCVLVLSVL